MPPPKTPGEMTQATRTRVDLGLKLPGVEAAGRLQPSKRVGGGPITHAIALASPEDIDDEVLRWLRAAYEANAARRKTDRTIA